MESALAGFLSIETIIFVLIVYIVVAVFRKVVEVLAKKIAPIFPDKYEHWWIEFWREWVLLSVPSIFGGLIAFFITGYPYPAVFAGSVAGRVFFGVVAGLCANNTYKFFSYYIKKLIPKRVEEEKSKVSGAVSVPEDSAPDSAAPTSSPEA